MGIPDHVPCLLRILYTDQATTVRSGHGTADWLQIAKGVYQNDLPNIPLHFQWYKDIFVCCRMESIREEILKISLAVCSAHTEIDTHTYTLTQLQYDWRIEMFWVYNLSEWWKIEC